MAIVSDDSQLSRGCVIMASGMGTRFGGNKLMAELAGKPLVEHVLDAVEGFFDKCVVVTRHSDVAALCETRGFQVVLHDLPHRNDTVRLGMEALGECDVVAFFQADQPLVRRATVDALLKALASNPDSIWRTQFDGNVGTPVLFPAWTFSELMSLPEKKGGGYVIKQHPECVRTVAAQDALELFDVDTVEGLEFLQEHLRA